MCTISNLVFCNILPSTVATRQISTFRTSTFWKASAVENASVPQSPSESFLAFWTTSMVESISTLVRGSCIPFSSLSSTCERALASTAIHDHNPPQHWYRCLLQKPPLRVHDPTHLHASSVSSSISMRVEASFNVPSEDTFGNHTISICGIRSSVVRFITLHHRNPNPAVSPESCSQSQAALWHPRTHLPCS